MNTSNSLVLGTAGHVDHGKSALVAALTGRDTDRLTEEKRRGMSIELGYAPLQLPSGRRLSVVDVPGHEDFVRTMVAGATGIDLFLLCVAADDGVMPQTNEHLAVLRALGVSIGVVAITRSDLADPAPARTQIEPLVPDCETVPVASPSGAGVEKLLLALERAVDEVPQRRHGSDSAVLHIDRSFTLRGHGTIVTGTLWSGVISVGDAVTILPQNKRVRVKSIQVHDRPVEQAHAGQRVALGLAGISRQAVKRGDVVSSYPAEIKPTYVLDAAIQIDAGSRPVKRGHRVQIHHGTRNVTARAIPLQGDEISSSDTQAFCQLRCESQLVPAGGDRLVIRQLAPPDTIGGGVVVDPAAKKHGPGAEIVDALRRLERGERPPIEDPPPRPSTKPQVALDDTALRIVELLHADYDRPRSDADLAVDLSLKPTDIAPRLRTLEHEGRLVRVGRNLHFHPEPLAQLTTQALRLCRRDGKVTIAALRDDLATSRRYAQALLEHLDAEGITIRRGDDHILRKRHRRDASDKLV